VSDRPARRRLNEHRPTYLIGRHLTTHSVYRITILMALVGPSAPDPARGSGGPTQSTGNAVRPADLTPVFGVDGLRYYLLREMILGQDSTYSYDSLVQRLNADLANDLGNLHSRVTKMAARYLDGRLPARADADGVADEAFLASAAEGLTTGEGGGGWRARRGGDPCCV
jgi:hypothetical protein